MAYVKLISQEVQDAIELFVSTTSLLALPLRFNESSLEASPFVCSEDMESSFQNKLNLLDSTFDPESSIYIALRQDDPIYVITFVPYRAPKDQCDLYLRYRHDVLERLEDYHIGTSLICKEIGEITDARSWTERNLDQQAHGKAGCTDGCEAVHEQTISTKDLGYKKSKCRLCDRRMKNKITADALKALSKLNDTGDRGQISLDENIVLQLDLQTSLPPSDVSCHLPTMHPTFTFYRHPNALFYFNFHSPDSASVQQRMNHTMAIPGTINAHAEDCGVHVDQKIEIHKPDELVFEEGDKKVGRFRSMYLRGEWKGTESDYEGLK